MSEGTSAFDHTGGWLEEGQPRGAAGVLEGERERFFLWSPVCLGLGIACYFALPVEPQLFVACVPLLVFVIMRTQGTPGTVTSALLTALILAGGGFAIAKLRVEAVRAPVLSKSIRNAEITGVVTLVEVRFPKGQRLTITSPQIAGIAAERTPVVIRVRTISARSDARPGDLVRLKATLSPPAKPPLPGGFVMRSQHPSSRDTGPPPD